MKQSLAEIREQSAQMLAAERENAYQVLETTPRELTDRLRDFCAELASATPAYIPVVSDPHGLYGWCSDGVTEKIKADGGSCAFGWTLWEWPGALWTAEFHAVWQNSSGQLIDITPKPKNESSILFVHDPSYPQDFDFDDRPGNKRARICEAVDPVAFAAAAIDRLKPAQLEYESRRAEKAGLGLSEWMQRKCPSDPLPKLVDDMIAACNEHEDYFDTLGSSGLVPADRKLMALMKRRYDTLHAVKRALANR